MDDHTPANTGSTETNESYMGATGDTPDANTNLDPALPGGPTTEADRQATETIEDRHTESRGLQSGENEQSDPARQMDNSGMLQPTGQGQDAATIGASGDDRNENR